MQLCVCTSEADCGLRDSCVSDVEALVSSREVKRELMIAVCVIWRRRSAWPLSELQSDRQDVAEVDGLIHLTVDSLQRTALKGSHAAFRVGCAFLCPAAGYGRTKYMSNSGLYVGT